MNSIRCRQCEHYIEANAGEGKIYGCDRSKCVFEPTTKNDLGVDCISRAEMLKYQEYLHGKMSNEENHKLWKFIKDLPSVTPQEPRWIPVSERLPENKTYVLVTIGIPGRQPHARSGWYQDGFFHNDNGDCWRATDIEVKAWMPLPKAYGEVEE